MSSASRSRRIQITGRCVARGQDLHEGEPAEVDRGLEGDLLLECTAAGSTTVSTRPDPEVAREDAAGFARGRHDVALLHLDLPADVGEPQEPALHRVPRRSQWRRSRAWPAPRNPGPAPAARTPAAARRVGHLADEPGAGDDRACRPRRPCSSRVDRTVDSKLPGRTADDLGRRRASRVLDRRQIEQLLELTVLGDRGLGLGERASLLVELLPQLGVLVLQRGAVRDAVDPVADRLEHRVDPARDRLEARRGRCPAGPRSARTHGRRA